MQVTLGIVTAVFAGSINGLFALPMKLARKWSWENIWLPFSILALVILPPLLMLPGIPHLGRAYASLNWPTLLIALLWGIAPYSGSLMFGRSIVYIGNALSFALLVGGMSIVGVLAPLLIYSPADLHTFGGKWIVFGVILLLGGLALCARAGSQKAENSENNVSSRREALLGMTLAFAGGALSGLLALGLNTEWAHRISNAAWQIGAAQKALAANAVLILVYIGGAIPNCLYASYLLSSRGTWRDYKHSCLAYSPIVLLMAIVYAASGVLWGVSTSPTMLGRLGPSVGWALFIGAIAVSSNIGGFLTGEWKNAGAAAKRLMIGGLIVMVAAIGIVGFGNLQLNK
jgi:L-rhamnose-proton symport protein RhaT